MPHCHPCPWPSQETHRDLGGPMVPPPKLVRYYVELQFISSWELSSPPGRWQREISLQSVHGHKRAVSQSLSLSPSSFPILGISTWLCSWTLSSPSGRGVFLSQWAGPWPVLCCPVTQSVPQGMQVAPFHVLLCCPGWALPWDSSVSHSLYGLRRGMHPRP